jgi:hypothetical protein
MAARIYMLVAGICMPLQLPTNTLSSHPLSSPRSHPPGRPMPTQNAKSNMMDKLQHSQEQILFIPSLGCLPHFGCWRTCPGYATYSQSAAPLPLPLRSTQIATRRLTSPSHLSPVQGGIPSSTHDAQTIPCLYVCATPYLPFGPCWASRNQGKISSSTFLQQELTFPPVGGHLYQPRSSAPPLYSFLYTPKRLAGLPSFESHS